MIGSPLHINGTNYDVQADPRALLLDVIREELGLSGTKYGCGEGECGACTVLVNGRPVNSCLVPVGRVVGAVIETIEGVADSEAGRAVVDAFVRSGGVQCGFCTPGFVVSATALRRSGESPADARIDEAIAGNLCRCTGYTKIRSAITDCLSAAAPSPPPAGSRPVSAGAFRTLAYLRPDSLGEALDLLETDPELLVLAGGTDLLPRHEYGMDRIRLLDLSALNELFGIEETDRCVRIGALATYSDVRSSSAVRDWAPELRTAASLIGGRQIQNVGTVVGNVVNASPVGDSIPALFVTDALLRVRSCRAERVVTVRDFIANPGESSLTSGELVTHIEIPKTIAEQRVSFFDRVGSRRAQAITKASIAFRAAFDGERLENVRIALGAVGPTVLSAPDTEILLAGGRLTRERIQAARALVATEITPIDDVRSTSDYRKHVAGGLLARNLLPLVSF